MTQDEEILSNISYTNSDFRTIYSELLDTTKKLSNSWDPSLSNESDPGVLLIKENALVADKNNYHCDKNILEAFPLSLTQQASARQLYAIAGYNMHWYQSAVCDVTFNLLKTMDVINTAEGTTLTGITIPAGTQVVDSSGEYVYSTLTTSTTLNDGIKKVTVEAIQGKINPYEINGNPNITLDNLDENLRLYFSSSLIAENGIYVYPTGTSITRYANTGLDPQGVADLSLWKKVDNLSQYEVGSKVFKFGVDVNSDNCYIEFPSDISNLIGSGLNIYYVTTLGHSGTVKASILNTLAADLTQSDKTNSVVVNSYLAVTNTASTTGKDPEDLDSAYKNYKKTIGTFETLVTRKDYENAIYNLRNAAGTNNLTSNSVVADRTTDINYSNKIINWNLAGDFARNSVKTENSAATVKPYDVVLYLFKSPDSMGTISDYNESFKQELSEDVKYQVEDKLEDLKSIQQDLKYVTDLTTEDGSSLLFNVDNLCRLNGKLTTFYKITSSEAREIQNNVILTLIEKYNSREIDLGSELEYDNLVEAIKSADARIRNVSLDIPRYTPYMKKASVLMDPINLHSGGETAENLNNQALARMVLAGNVQLFSFNNDFQFDFGQTGSIINNIKSITTTNPIEITKVSGTDLDDIDALNKNDLVYVVTPVLNTVETYEASVKVLSNVEIPSDTTYVLGDTERVKFIYTENGENKFKVYGAGTIINPVSVKIAATTTTDTDYENTSAYNTLLRVNQSVNIKQLSNITIPQGVPYYIVSNTKKDGNYIISLTANNPYVLSDNEYLVFTNDTVTGLITLGSGTSISSTSDLTLISEAIDIEEITESSDTSKWNVLTGNLTAVENTIYTFTEGDKVAVFGVSGNITCSNDLGQLKGSDSSYGFVYQYSGEDSVKTISNIQNLGKYTIKYKSNMLLNATSTVPQVLQGSQKVSFVSTTGNPYEAEKDKYVLFNYPVNLAGGSNLDMQVLNTATGKYEYSLSAYEYTSGDAIALTTKIGDKEGTKSINREQGLLSVDCATSDYVVTSGTLNYTFGETKTEDYQYYLVPIVVSLTEGASLTFNMTNGSISTSVVNHSSDVGSIEIKNSGSYILVITSSGSGSLSFTVSGTPTTSDSIIFKYINIINGLNEEEIDVEEVANGTYFKYEVKDSITKVLSAMSGVEGSENFDWTYQPVTENKVLQPLSGSAYFNKNHIYNKYTLAKIDFENSTIEVNPSNIS